MTAKQRFMLDWFYAKYRLIAFDRRYADLYMKTLRDHQSRPCPHPNTCPVLHDDVLLQWSVARCPDER